MMPSENVMPVTDAITDVHLVRGVNTTVTDVNTGATVARGRQSATQQAGHMQKGPAIAGAVGIVSGTIMTAEIVRGTALKTDNVSNEMRLTKAIEVSDNMPRVAIRSVTRPRVA